MLPNAGLETTLRFCINFYLYTISALEEHGNTYKPVCIHVCRAYKQTVTYTQKEEAALTKLTNQVLDIIDTARENWEEIEESELPSTSSSIPDTQVLVNAVQTGNAFKLSSSNRPVLRRSFSSSSAGSTAAGNHFTRAMSNKHTTVHCTAILNSSLSLLLNRYKEGCTNSSKVQNCWGAEVYKVETKNKN
jgi:hypothetical protein